MAYYRQSKRRTAQFLGALFGQPCCPALTVKIQKQVTDALRPTYEALAAELPAQKQLNIDETGTKEANGKAWLWTFVARHVHGLRRAGHVRGDGLDRFPGLPDCSSSTR